MSEYKPPFHMTDRTVTLLAEISEQVGRITVLQFCKGVLTLLFDDIVSEVDGTVLFDDEMADKIIEFIEHCSNSVDTLLCW